MNGQPELDFNPPPPPPAEDEVTRLVTYLQSHPGFHTAKDLSSTFQIPDRKIRQLAEAAAGLIVSGPGAPGYIHLHHCPTEQLGHIAESLISQGKAMIQRGIRTRKLAHQAIR